MRITFGLILTLALFLILSACSIASSHTSEWLAISLIVLAGIPHGSFDVQVAKSKWQTSPRSLIAIITLYVISAVGMTSLCIVIPLALIAVKPVGATIACGLLVFCLKYSSNVDFPQPAFPVMNKLDFVFSIVSKILLNSFVNTKEDGKSVPVSNSILSDNFYNF